MRAAKLCHAIIFLVRLGGPTGSPSKTSEVKHLHAMVPCLTHNVSPVGMNLDVSPSAGCCGRRHNSDDHWICWDSDINEASAFAKANDGVLVVSHWVNPAPNIVCPQGIEIG